MTRGERLGRAIDERARNISSFQQNLLEHCKKQKVPGASYSMVHRYLSGRSRPSAPLLSCVADVLKISAEWLITGEGSMTPTREMERAAAEAPQRLRFVEEGFKGELGDSLDPVAIAVLTRVWRFRMAWEGGDSGPANIAEALSREKNDLKRVNDYATAVEIAKAMTEPLRQMGIAYERLRPDELTDYLIGMSQVLVRVLEIAFKRDTVIAPASSQSGCV